MKKIFTLSMALFGIAALISACSDSSTSSGNTEAATGSSSSAVPDDPAMEELEANYELLNLMYIYGPERKDIAESVDVYVGKGTAKDAGNKFGEETCTADYYDVCHMYNQLTDPYTRYYDPVLTEDLLPSLEESDEDISIVGVETMSYDEDGYYFEVTYVSDEAKKGGIQVGDILLGYGVYYAYSDSTDGKPVKLKATRDGKDVEVSVVLTMEKQSTVLYHYEPVGTEDSIPVIRIKEFDSKTVGEGGTFEEFAKALKKTEGSKATIIDLRDNGGGDTEHCNAASAEFLSKGDTVTIEIEADMDAVVKDGETKLVQVIDTAAIVAEKDGSAKDRYVVMLADGGSASCAELMLSAIAVNKKAPIVGELTFGKQIAQSIITESALEGLDSVPDAFKAPKGIAFITSTIGYDKDWKSFQDVGIIPDYEIKGSRVEQMKKAVELAAEGKAKRTAGYGTEPLGHFEKSASAGSRKAQLKDLKRMRYKILR